MHPGEEFLPVNQPFSQSVIDQALKSIVIRRVSLSVVGSVFASMDCLIFCRSLCFECAIKCNCCCISAAVSHSPIDPFPGTIVRLTDYVCWALANWWIINYSVDAQRTLSLAACVSKTSSEPPISITLWFWIYSEILFGFCCFTVFVFSILVIKMESTISFYAILLPVQQIRRI